MAFCACVSVCVGQQHGSKEVPPGLTHDTVKLSLRRGKRCADLSSVLEAVTSRIGCAQRNRNIGGNSYGVAAAPVRARRVYRRWMQASGNRTARTTRGGAAPAACGSCEMSWQDGAGGREPPYHPRVPSRCSVRLCTKGF
eukprot:366298-Chlamydomonas_euryale.AAC.13